MVKTIGEVKRSSPGLTPFTFGSCPFDTSHCESFKENINYKSYR
jgi:hypothetical protein